MRNFHKLQRHRRTDIKASREPLSSFFDLRRPKHTSPTLRTLHDTLWKRIRDSIYTVQCLLQQKEVKRNSLLGKFRVIVNNSTQNVIIWIRTEVFTYGRYSFFSLQLFTPFFKNQLKYNRPNFFNKNECISLH